MAHSLSAKKRIRQNITRRARNRARKSQVKTQVRKFLDATISRDPSAAEGMFRSAQKRLDRVAAKGAIHRNAAARKKSRLARKLNALKAAEA